MNKLNFSSVLPLEMGQPSKPNTTKKKKRPLNRYEIARNQSESLNQADYSDSGEFDLPEYDQSQAAASSSFMTLPPYSPRDYELDNNYDSDFEMKSAGAFSNQSDENDEDDEEYFSAEDDDDYDDDLDEADEFLDDMEEEDVSEDEDEERDSTFYPNEFERKLASRKIIPVVFGFYIICMDIFLQNLPASFQCECGRDIRLYKDTLCSHGLVHKFYWLCTSPSCHRVHREFYSSSKNAQGLFEINFRFFLGTRVIGAGMAACRQLCTLMGFEAPLAQKNLKPYKEAVLKALKVTALESLKKAAAEAKSFGTLNGAKCILAAFDGSWQRRGFHSRNGIVTAADPNSNKILDVCVYSKYCNKCRGESARQTGCDCNFNSEKSSGSMEVHGVKEMFRRSVRLFGTVYKYYLGDGDTKGYKEVVQDKPYGEHFEIEKKDCVNHYCKKFKRLCSTYIRKLKEGDGKKKKKIVVGGKGKITEKYIDRLQSYFGNAIRQNLDDLDAMRNAIMATYYHHISTDKKPQHHLCPMDSWCQYNQSDRPANFKHNHRVPVDCFIHMKDFYESLCSAPSLENLKHAMTQNVIESFNSKVWSRAPKRVYLGLDSLKLAVFDSIICHNEGYLSRTQIFEELGFTPGPYTTLGLQKMDADRIRNKEKPKHYKGAQKFDSTTRNDYLYGGYHS